MAIFSTLSLFFIISLIVTNQFPTAATTKISKVANFTNPPPPVGPRITPFRPGIAIMVGILTTIFSITFLLLLYMKHCRPETRNSNNAAMGGRNSGVGRKVIESLPLLRLSSLKGRTEGLECAVCLNGFGPDEVLRLLPKCAHAFHVECVDTWLDAHSKCPLCRTRVEPEDVLLLSGCGDRIVTPLSSDDPGKGNPRVPGRHSSAGEKFSSPNPDAHDSRARVSLDSWRPRQESPGRRDGRLPVKAERRRLEVGAAEVLHWKSESLIGERSASETRGVRVYNNGGRKEREVVDWIRQNPAVHAAAAAASASSSIVVA